MSGMNMELICNGEVVNKHSDGGRHYGWTNPIDILPPVGSIIEYLTFNQSHLEGQGVLRKYQVLYFTFCTEEDFNNSYRGQVCRIHVQEI